MPHAGKILLQHGELAPLEPDIRHAGLSLYVPAPWSEGQLGLMLETILHNVRLQRQNASLLSSLEEHRREMDGLQLHIEARVRERTQALEEANRRLSHMAVTDGLTGLYNHRYLQEHLVLEVERSLRTGIPLGMLMIDVDHFRQYNNRFGHQTGDEVLRRVARLIAEHRRVNDVVARYGGEEFALLLINADHRVAYRIAERLRQRVNSEPFPETRDIPGGHLTISVGVASCPADGTSAAGLIAAADAALFAAKHAGRNTVRVASEIEAPAMDSASDLRAVSPSYPGRSR
jgi:diguanylate cyclase (GGDEF)-like protein